MMVTDLNYHLETMLVHKLDIMIKRCVDKRSRKDAVLICEGAEGEGKTNSSEAVAYYVKYTAKEKYKKDMGIHLFFRLQALIDFAKDNEGKIIIWDEPALDSLSSDWFKTTNKDLIRLLMVCRKKRHFFIFNFVKFYKFSEYVVVDRAIGLIHMYSRKGINPGRFFYIRNNKLEGLYIAYRKTKKREYKKYKAFGGRFPIIEDKLGQMSITIEGKPNCTLDDYELLKNEAISSIGRRETPYEKNLLADLTDLKIKIGKMSCPIKNRSDLAFKLDVSVKTLYNWRDIPPISGKNQEKPVLECNTDN